MKLVVLYYFRSVAIINIAIMSLFEQVSYFNEAEGDRGMQLKKTTRLTNVELNFGFIPCFDISF